MSASGPGGDRIDNHLVLEMREVVGLKCMRPHANGGRFALRLIERGGHSGRHLRGAPTATMIHLLKTPRRAAPIFRSRACGPGPRI